MKQYLLGVSLALLVSACAQTSVQPLTRSSFKISTQAAPACGQQGARDVAFKTAAIEVIRRGADAFIVVGDQSGSRTSGGAYLGYGVWQSYNDNLQDMVIQIVDPSNPDSLSARQTLGPDWRELVAKGSPQTCTA